MLKKAVPIVLFFTLIMGEASAAEKPCAFCNEAVLKTETIAISDLAVVLYNRFPAKVGHLLVIPKRHAPRFEDLTVEEVASINELIRKAVEDLKKTYHITDYMLVQKNGKVAGQKVEHVHFHILPATENDYDAFLTQAFHTKAQKIDDTEMRNRVDVLKGNFDSSEE